MQIMREPKKDDRHKATAEDAGQESTPRKQNRSSSKADEDAAKKKRTASHHSSSTDSSPSSNDTIAVSAKEAVPSAALDVTAGGTAQVTEEQTIHSNGNEQKHRNDEDGQDTSSTSSDATAANADADTKQNAKRPSSRGRRRQSSLPSLATLAKKRGRIVRMVNIAEASIKVQQQRKQVAPSTPTSINSKSWPQSGEDVKGSPLSSTRQRPVTHQQTSTGTAFPALPDNQYVAVLKRRATRKIELDGSNSNTTATSTNGTNNSIDDDNNDDDDNELRNHRTAGQNEYGDISLGMKLIVVGGRVIVQSLNPLSNGFASPAQLTGVIQRGDVLLAVGDLSLVNLPVHHLMEGLQPLSTPDHTGRYQEVLKLRFESATGFDLLRLHEEGQTALRAQTRPETADAMMSLFPMVDQLSGELLFNDQNSINDDMAASDGDDEKEVDPTLAAKSQFKHVDGSTPNSKTAIGAGEYAEDDINAMISSVLAKGIAVDRMLYDSEFFDWKDNLPRLLRKPSEVRGQDDNNDRLTKAERLELGKKIMQIIKSVELHMEEIDKGRDLRSFKTWSTKFSLRSGISARRRYIIDTTSISSRRVASLDSSADVESIDSGASEGSLDGVDPDTLLLGLAARDEIWRKQVIDDLKRAKDRMTENEDNEVHSKDAMSSSTNGNRTGIDAAFTNHLGNFLFGQNISKIVKQEKESYALPPKDITRVLFDLTTNLATKAPNEITIFGGSSKLSSNLPSLQSRSTKTENKSRSALRADILLANRFVLDEALPVWLNSFRPLPLEHRRILWPRTRRSTDSVTGTYTGNPSSSGGDSDTLSLGSAGSVAQPSLPSKKRDLRERVEEHQIDAETRSETCFLVTYFYKKKLLATDLRASSFSVDPITFVEKYGAYLELHSCLTFAASVKNESAINNLLNAASFDPIHRDTVKDIQVSKDLMFYDPSKLSAVLQFLVGIRYDASEDRRKVIRDLCVSAYPDILPWQVTKACLDSSFCPSFDSVVTQSLCPTETMEDWYYSYMTLLLNPNDGHEEARHDAKLVVEWCKWSAGILPRPHKHPDRLKNFYLVTSRSSEEYKNYRRDLRVLLDLTMEIDDTYQGLDLIEEVMETDDLLSKEETVQRTLVHLRSISDKGIAMIQSPSSKADGFRILLRVLGLFEKMAGIHSVNSQGQVTLSQEIFKILKKERNLSRSDGNSFYELLDFIIEKSTSPRDILRALSHWSISNDVDEAIYERLQKLLIRGVDLSHGELSGTLIRIRQHRTEFMDTMLKAGKNNDQINAAVEIVSKEGIWQRMSKGQAKIDK